MGIETYPNLTETLVCEEHKGMFPIQDDKDGKN